MELTSQTATITAATTSVIANASTPNALAATLQPINWSRIAGIVLGFNLLICFQSFDVASKVKKSDFKLDEKSRVQHAKELLGKEFKSSIAYKARKINSLSNYILAEVETNLPKEYKNKAKSLTRTILTDSKKYELDPVFILAVMKTESSFNPIAVGTVGERGLMQIIPETAEWVAKKYQVTWKGPKSLFDPTTNARIGIRYFHWLRTHFGKMPSKYVSAYNMGAKKVREMYSNDKKPRIYATKVMKNYEDTYAKIYEGADTKL